MLNPKQKTPLNFSNRIVEIELVARRVEILQSGRSAFQCVLNFYGIPGVGKTRLLEQLHSLARSGGWTGRTLAPVISALVDLNPAALTDEPYLVGPNALIGLMKQIQDQTGVISKNFRESIDVFRRQAAADPQDEDTWYLVRQAAKRVADSFNYHLYAQSKAISQPVVLLFDNSDKAGAEAFDWLEFEVFSPLVETNRVLLILTGSSPVRWKRFEVRRRVYLGKLNPPEERIQLVTQQAPSWAKVADNIVQLTFGLPTANETVVETLDKIAEPQIVDAGTFDRYRPQLMERLITDLVENRLWRNIEQKLWPVFRLVAPLRQFDVTTLRNVLPKLEPEQFAELGGNQYLLMLNQLIDTNLVEWSTERKAYILDDTLRHILALDMETRALPQAIEIHRIAAALYDEWLTEAAESRSSYLVEWLYHSVKGYTLNGKELTTVAALATADLQRQMERLYDLSGARDERLADSVRRLLNELSRDDELAALLGKQARDGMVQLVQGIEQALMSK